MIGTLEQRGEALFTQETFDGNGRVCSTCHEPDLSGTITPEWVEEQFALDPEGPLFRAIDSDDGDGASYDRLREHATIRIPIVTPFDEVLGRAIRRCDAPEKDTVFVFRGNPSVFNVALEEALMHDGREGGDHVTMTAHDMVSEGDKVFVRLTMAGTHEGEFMGMPATGRQVAVPMADFIRLEEGKVAEHWGVTDVAAMMEQLGGTQD